LYVCQFLPAAILGAVSDAYRLVRLGSRPKRWLYLLLRTSGAAPLSIKTMNQLVPICLNRTSPLHAFRPLAPVRLLPYKPIILVGRRYAARPRAFGRRSDYDICWEAKHYAAPTLSCGQCCVEHIFQHDILDDVAVVLLHKANYHVGLWTSGVSFELRLTQMQGSPLAPTTSHCLRWTLWLWGDELLSKMGSLSSRSVPESFTRGQVRPQRYQRLDMARLASRLSRPKLSGAARP
jgi:hypothetical protein